MCLPEDTDYKAYQSSCINNKWKGLNCDIPDLKICRGITNSNKYNDSKTRTYIIIGIASGLVIAITLSIIIMVFIHRQKQINDYIKNNDNIQITILDSLV